MMVSRRSGSMNRSLIVVLITILLILPSVVTLGAQGRGHFRGGVSAGAGVNIPPVVRPGGPIVSRPPFAVAPVHNPAVGFRPVQPFRPFRPVHPVVVPPVYGFYSPFYSPYIWPTTYYSDPAYSAYSAPP